MVPGQGVFAFDPNTLTTSVCSSIQLKTLVYRYVMVYGTELETPPPVTALSPGLNTKSPAGVCETPVPLKTPPVPVGVAPLRMMGRPFFTVSISFISNGIDTIGRGLTSRGINGETGPKPHALAPVTVKMPEVAFEEKSIEA